MEDHLGAAKPVHPVPQRVHMDDGAGRTEIHGRLRTLDLAVARVQAIARRRRQGDGSSVVDAFIADRRAEAAGD